MRFVFAWPLLLALSLLAVGCNNDVAVHVSSCFNKVSDGTESDVDCGGSCPAACADGKSCREAKDCASGGCVDKRCVQAAPPVVSAVEPWSGPVEGGTTVKLTGTGFAGAMKVRFGSAEATDVTVVGTTELSAKTPAGEAGPADVMVASASGVSSTIPGGFVYAAESSGPLAVTSVVPSSGGISGGTRGVVSGAGFDAAAKLYFGGVAATRARVLDDKRIVFTAPANRAGRVDVLVVNPGARAARMAGAFEYFAAQGPAPKVVGVFPSRIAVGSPSTLEATGEHLGDGSLVFVGDEPATVKTASDGSVSFVLPPGLPAGTYEVTVTTRDGQTVTLEGALEVLAPSCDDAVANGTETDVDCGGACPACADGHKCALPADCVSKVCAGGLCAASSCVDQAKNGQESDVDCGASCPACAALLHCRAAADCASGVCTGGVCEVPACNDGVKNGLESDLDCGASCPGCADGLGCLVATDCQSRVCAGGRCSVPACDDVVKNGGESDVDCGGTCPACGIGKACLAGADCSSGVCAGGVCLAPRCDDRVKNGPETSVDCGGTCAACGVGQGCAVAADCASGVCTGNVCQAPSCTDGARNGHETGLDCGGGTCPACGTGLACAVPGDCVSGVCTGNVCQAPSCTDGARNGNETGLDCGGGTCPACGTGLACAVPGDCASGVCTGGICQAPSCTDGARNGSETSADCGGGTCPACGTGLACAVPGDCASGVCTGGICQTPSTVLLMHLDGASGSTTFTDSTARHGFTGTGSAQLTTAASRFGGASLRLDGTNDSFISTPVTADLQFGNGDFTIEFFYRDAGTTDLWARLFQLADGDVFTAVSIVVNAGQVVLCMASQGAGSWDVVPVVPIGAVSTSQFDHFAVSRQASTIRYFKNGVLQGTINSTATLDDLPNATLVIGGQTSPKRALIGDLDELRVSKGRAWYTTDFTPPTAPFSPP